MISHNASVFEGEDTLGEGNDARVVRHDRNGSVRVAGDFGEQIGHLDAVAASRLAVGSSASTIAGAWAMARATATRCFSPCDI